MLLNPVDNKAVGLPDSTTARTALYRSIRTYSVYANFSTGAASGRFSVAVQPKLGSIASPNQYSVAITQFQNENDVDFGASTAYVSSVSGTDPRVDDNISLLTYPPLGFYSQSITVPGATLPDYRTATPSVSNRGLSVDIRQNGSDWNAMLLPPGQYLFSIYQTAGAGQVINFTGSTGVVATTISGSQTADGANVISCDFIMTVSPNAKLVIGYGPLVAGTTQTIHIAPIITSAQLSENYGVTKKVRPVAMSALLSYSATTLQNGGMVAACLVPGDSVIDNFFTNSPTLGGNYQLWENLSRVPGAYNGPLREGTYTYWRPDNELDNYLRVPDDANVYAFPSILISGEFVPGTNLTGLVEIGRLEVCTVYEWTTTSTLFESYTRVGSHSVMDAVNNAILPYPTSMSNPIHLEDVKRYLRSALDWAKRNRALLIAGATALGSLL